MTAPGGNRVRLLWASGHNILINGSIPNLVLRVFLYKTPYLISVIDSLTVNSGLSKLYLTRVFSRRHIPALLCSGAYTARQHYTRGHFKQRDHRQKAQNRATRDT